MPLETVLMSKQLMRRYNSASKSLDIMCFCEPCQKIFKVIENSNHFNTESHALVTSDLTELFYCKYCRVEFYSSRTVYECHELTTEHIIFKSEHNNIDMKITTKPLHLDFHLLKLVTNQKLYEEIRGITYFCFACNFLSPSKKMWKTHINGKKHTKSSKGSDMDHCCTICKILMFGERHHMFEHYSSVFHSMLRQFKLITSNNVPNKNDLLLHKNCEQIKTCIMETTFEKNQTATLDSNSPGECNTNINEEFKTKKSIDTFSVEPISQQDSSKLGESNDILNEAHLVTTTITLNKIPLESNTQNYSNFYKTRIKMLNEFISQNREIKTKLFYYCLSCDFITLEQKIWDNHNLTDHSSSTEVRHHMFCDICSLYLVGPSNNFNNHINTIEHKTIEDFIQLYKPIYTRKTKEKGSLISDIPTDFAKISVTDKQEKINDRKNEEPVNRKVMVEIKGIKLKYRKNSWVELKKIFASYGYFGIYTKHNTALISFRKLPSVNHMLKDKEKLEKIHEFTISVTGVDDDDEKLPELNKTTEFEFKNKQVLLNVINTQLQVIKNEITNTEIPNRLILLINSIHRYTYHVFCNGRTYTFGSRMSGLALKESDVDLYFDIGNTFHGLLSNDLNAQEDLVRYFGKVLRSHSEFKHVQLITGARVPIVKFLHCPSGLNCDLSFKSGLSTHNTKLVRLYLALDERIHWIVCAVVKRWALQNNLKSQRLFTSYALVWLVLFYLMTIDVVPTLKILRENATRSLDLMFIEDWDCTFCSLSRAKQIWKVPVIPHWDLLSGFFKFYSDPDRLKQFVLCPAIGEAIPKEKFMDIPKDSEDKLGFHKKKNGDVDQWCIKIRSNFNGEGLAVQDPFDLFHNITKAIAPRKLQCFSHLCDKTLELMCKDIKPRYE